MAQQGNEGTFRLVAMAWGVAAAPQRGPKRELTHERIVEAAIEIADAEGLAAVTMQRVAKTFGFTTMALYRYISSKDDLRGLMLDAVTGDGGWAIDDENWREGLEHWVRTIMRAYTQHPWALDVPVAPEAMLMPGQVRAVDAGMRALRTLSATPEDKLGVLMMLAVTARGFAALAREMDPDEVGRPGARDDAGGEEARQLVREIVAEGRFPDARPVIDSGAYFGESGAGAGAGAGSDEPGTEDDLAVALSLLMPGIEQAFADAAEAPGPPGIADEDAPSAVLASAESELAAVIALRKATQRRARELEKREGRLRAERDRAKAAAKAQLKGAASPKG